MGLSKSTARPSKKRVDQYSSLSNKSLAAGSSNVAPETCAFAKLSPPINSHDNGKMSPLAFQVIALAAHSC